MGMGLLLGFTHAHGLPVASQLIASKRKPCVITVSTYVGIHS